MRNFTRNMREFHHKYEKSQVFYVLKLQLIRRSNYEITGFIGSDADVIASYGCTGFEKPVSDGMDKAILIHSVRLQHLVQLMIQARFLLMKLRVL